MNAYVNYTALSVQKTCDGLEEGLVEESIVRVFVVFVLLGQCFWLVDDFIEVKVRPATKIILIYLSINDSLYVSSLLDEYFLRLVYLPLYVYLFRPFLQHGLDLTLLI